MLSKWLSATFSAFPKQLWFMYNNKQRDIFEKYTAVKTAEWSPCTLLVVLWCWLHHVDISHVLGHHRLRGQFLVPQHWWDISSVSNMQLMWNKHPDPSHGRVVCVQCSCRLTCHTKPGIAVVWARKLWPCQHRSADKLVVWIKHCETILERQIVAACTTVMIMSNSE